MFQKSETDREDVMCVYVLNHPTEHTRIATRHLLYAIQNGLNSTEINGFTFGQTVPAIIFGGRKNHEQRIKSTLEERIAAGLRAEEQLWYYHDTVSGASRWEIPGGGHLRLVSAGDLGSTQFAAVCHVNHVGGTWLFFPDLIHLIARREAQARCAVDKFRKTVAKVSLACRALKGPFSSNKNRKAMTEAHGRMLEA